MNMLKIKPLLIITWEGLEPEKESILLNCHYDVVPVSAPHWNYEPFTALETPDNEIVGRGTQDMKSVGMQYLEAIRRMILRGIRLKRTVHMSFVPDEEIGGHDGMEIFLKQPEFKDLNVGCAMDEGLATPEDVYNVFYAERSVWWILISVTGNAGHGSQFIDNCATLKLQKIIQRFVNYRNEQEAKLHANPDLHLGDVTTVNLTHLKAGINDLFPFVNINVVPNVAHCSFDCRITAHDLPKWDDLLKEWCNEEGVTYSFKQKDVDNKPTNMDPTKNIYWKNMRKVFDDLNVKVDCRVFPAATDGRYLRMIDIPVFGFSPMIKTKVLFHDHDERIHKQTFLDGIEMYIPIISALANTE